MSDHAEPPRRRTGRRPGDSGTRDAILDAASDSFGTAGYAGTTIRGVARTAGVDPALVHHYFGSKDDLFAAVVELPVDPSTLVPLLLADGPDGLGERVVMTFLNVWDNTPGQGPMLALLRSAASDQAAAKALGDFLSRVLFGPLAEAVSTDDAPMRAALAASQMAGLAVVRYVLRLEPLASATPEAIAPVIGPTVDRYLRGTPSGLSVVEDCASPGGLA